MTTVIGIIGEDTVSNDILEMDIWFESLAVGRWQIILKNIAHKWGDDFQPNNVVDLKIDDITMLKGYVDDVLPYLDDKGVYKNLIKIVGRDNARDLARLYCTAGYVDIEADDIIRDLFVKTGSEILGPALTTTPVVTISRQRTFLIDWIKNIALRPSPNYEAYVDQAKTLQLFQVGDGDYHSDVDLTSIAAALDNNILRLEKGEAVGFSIANCVELSAGSLRDHWTEGNAVDWDPGAGTYQPVDETEDENLRVVGMGSIKFGCAENAFPSMILDFSGVDGLYSHSALDLSKNIEMSYYIRNSPITLTGLSVRPRFEDSNGNIIEFKRAKPSIGVAQKGKTDEATKNTWHKVQINIGKTLEKKENGDPRLSETEEKWYFINGTAFDWVNVVKIIFRAAEATLGAADIWIDNLCIQTVEVISIAEDDISKNAYGKAMYFDRRDDIRSQIELDVISGHTGGRGELAKRKDPLKTIRVTAIGQTGSRYAGKSLDVQAPGHGIIELTKYRIVKIHHRVTKKTTGKGFNFITVYDLVKHTLSPGTQVIDSLRLNLSSDPRGTLIEILNLTRRRVRTAEGTERAEFGDTHPVSKVFFSEHGPAFTSDPDDGCQFWLTVDYHDGVNQYYGAPEGIGYQYDATAEIWKRVPVILRRSQDPPSGGEIEGDILYRIDQDIWYQWNGSIWYQTSSRNIADMPDVSSVEWPTDQLAIETRGWATDLAFIWGEDEEPPDWNKIWWGQGGDEKLTDASIKFKDGTTVGINKGTNTAHANGIWFYYWDDNFKTGDKYDLQKSQNFADSVGVGKGQIAYVEINNTDSETPSLIVVDGYTPVIGAGIVGLYSIFGKHLSFDWITGKNFRTADDVGELGGPAGIRFNKDEIAGYSGGTTKEFYLSSDGKAYAGGVLLDSSGITLAGQAAWFYANSLLRGQIYPSWFEFSDDLFAFRAPNASALIYADLDVLLYPGSGRAVLPYQSGIKLGKVGDEWLEAHADDFYGKLHFERSTLAGRPAASAELLGTGWATRETDEEEIFWFCGLNAAGTAIWIDLMGGDGGGDMLKSIYDQNDDGVVDDSKKFDGFLQTSFGILSLSRTWTGIQTFSHATPIKLNDIMERTADHGVEIDGVLLKDGLVEVAAIADLPTSAITSGQFSLLQMPRGIDGYVLTGTGVGSSPAYEAIAAGDMLKSVYDQNDDGVVDDSHKFDGFLETAFGKLALSRAWTGTQTFSHATPIKLDDIMERTAAHGVDIDGVLLKDGLVELSAIPTLSIAKISDIPGTIASILTDHTKAIHDALNIDADTVDSKNPGTGVGNLAYYNASGAVVDSYKFDGFLRSSFGILSLSRTWTGTQTFAHATPIKLNDIMERTSGHGVDIDGVLLKDGLVELAAIPNLPTSKITSGQFSLTRMPRAASGLFLEGGGAGSNPLWNALIAANIPSLDTSKITTGTFNELRIPDIRADVKTSKPTPNATNLGRIYIVRSGSGVKSKVYICVLNDANGYEWIQKGVST